MESVSDKWTPPNTEKLVWDFSSFVSQAERKARDSVKRQRETIVLTGYKV
jgi:hypothetical protein